MLPTMGSSSPESLSSFFRSHPSHMTFRIRTSLKKKDVLYPASTGKKVAKPERDMTGAAMLMQTLLAPSTATDPVSDEVLADGMDREKGMSSDHFAAVSHVSRTGSRYLRHFAVKIEYNINPVTGVDIADARRLAILLAPLPHALPKLTNALMVHLDCAWDGGVVCLDATSLWGVLRLGATAPCRFCGGGGRAAARQYSQTNDTFRTHADRVARRGVSG
jgi:hypothetical protein